MCICFLHPHKLSILIKPMDPDQSNIEKLYLTAALTACFGKSKLVLLFKKCVYFLKVRLERGRNTNFPSAVYSTNLHNSQIWATWVAETKQSSLHQLHPRAGISRELEAEVETEFKHRPSDKECRCLRQHLDH